MKILSWNINGIRASKVDIRKLLDSLDADVICLQETKVTRDMLDEPTAIVEGYNSYFSFSRKKSGYSGVASFCKNSVTPFKAEEGLSGNLTTTEDGSVGCYGNQTTFTEDELKDLDSEGRAVITQHKIRSSDEKEEDLAIINVYCPRFDPDREDRHLYKLRFYALLQTRAEALLESGCHVIILGDINTTHKDIDVCDVGDEASLKRPSRLWLNQMIWEEGRDDTLDDVLNREEFAGVTPHTRGGKFIDTYRHLFPEKEGAFTNWCTLTNARSTNFGRRLDYILGDIPLVKSCLKDAVIMQDVEGSDHCPTKIEFSCSPIPAKTCPPFCTKYMPEFQGKQQKLSTFFTRVKREATVTVIKTTENETTNNAAFTKGCNEKLSEKASSIKRSFEKKNDSAQPAKKQKTDLKKTASGVKQASLKSFFSKGPSINNATSMVSEQSEDGDTVEPVNSVEMESSNTVNLNSITTENERVKDIDVEETVNGSKEKLNAVNENSKQAASAWKNLLGGLGPAPLCKGHNEPCVLRTVKKPGPNKGKQFYTCARGEGLKSNPEARCDYFKWVEKKKKS